MSTSSLRSLIRVLVSEAAVTLSQVKGENLALHVSKNYPRPYVLYDPVSFSQHYEDDVSPNEAAGSVVAMIEVWRPQRGETWGASEVKSAAAVSGYGPFLYDMVMSREGGLMADRDYSNVSKDAQRVWQYYKDRRPDVVAKKLDDIDEPVIPPTVDDAEVHTVGKAGIETDAVNYAYFSKRKVNVDQLVRNHERAPGTKFEKAKRSFSIYSNVGEAAGLAFFALRLGGRS